MTKKGIITVVGKDQVGIIANVCNYLAEENINILDINQTILDQYFNMMMVVDLENATREFAETVEGLNHVGERMGLIIKLQLEDIFNKMHRI